MDVREAILNASTKLFAERGFDATPLQAIADVVGIRKPSLLYHFPSKEELRQAVLEQLLSHWSEVLPRLLMAAAQDGMARFDRVVEELLDFFAADPDRARLLVREALDRPSEMRTYLSQFVRPWIDLVAEYIRKGQRTGEISPDVDPESYVVQVVSLVLAGFATADCLGVVLVEGDEAVRSVHPRHTIELVRIMKSSLFSSRAESAEAELHSAGEVR